MYYVNRAFGFCRTFLLEKEKYVNNESSYFHVEK